MTAAGLARRIAGLLGRALLFVLLTLGVAEGALRVASLFMRDRAAGWRPGASRRVLCVGDSHTYGAGVEAADAYPEQLQRLLDAESPGVYAVANLGIPGMSTTQVRNRLPEQLDRLRPDVVVVWCGVNNVWNRLDEDLPRESWWSPVQAFVTRLRLTRLVRVWLQNDEIEQQTRDVAGKAFGDRPRFTVALKQGEKNAVDWGDQVEELHFRMMGRRTDDEAGRLATADYEAIVDLTRARGVPVVLIEYPLGWEIFTTFNRAMETVAREKSVPLVDSGRALLRVPVERRKLVYMAHPGAAIYGEIARDVAARVRALAPPPG